MNLKCVDFTVTKVLTVKIVLQKKSPSKLLHINSGTFSLPNNKYKISGIDSFYYIFKNVTKQVVK